MGGGGSAPEPDPQIGEAALISAKLGRKYLGWMKERAKVTDAWAADDRARHQNTFIPLQDRFIDTAKGYASPARQRTEAREAVADVAQQIKIGRESSNREMAAMGVDPSSRRFASAKRIAGLEGGLAKTGAANLARRTVRAEGMKLMGDAVNLGQGLGVNPLSAFSAGTAAVGQGFQGAMDGARTQGDLLNQQYRSQLAGWQSQQDSQGSVFGALGTVAGMAMGSPWLSATMGGLAGMQR